MRIAAGIILVLVVGVVVWLYFGQRGLDRKRSEAEQLAANCERGSNDEQFEKRMGNATYRNPDYDKLVGRYPQIHEGMDMNAVGQLLGPPSYSQALITKDGVEFTGCHWIYVLEQSGNPEERIQDVIAVLMTPDGKVSSHFWKSHPGQ